MLSNHNTSTHEEFDWDCDMVVIEVVDFSYLTVHRSDSNPARPAPGKRWRHCAETQTQMHQSHILTSSMLLQWPYFLNLIIIIWIIWHTTWCFVNFPQGINKVFWLYCILYYFSDSLYLSNYFSEVKITIFASEM